ncbi:MAG: response regulator [Anaerolineae bacterium]|nr:response regulator [Anaerolineae bacterium]
MPTILLVDENRSMLRVLQLMFERAHYRVLLATQGETAQMLVRQEQPDVVLLDEAISDMNAWELCWRLKYDEQYPPAVILHTTGSDTSRVPGADAVLRKPSHPGVLLTTVEGCLRAKV